MTHYFHTLFGVLAILIVVFSVPLFTGSNDDLD